MDSKHNRSYPILQIEYRKLLLYINPIRTGGPELTIKTGGGQKRLRYIIGPYLGHFKSDFIGVKSKFQNYID